MSLLVLLAALGAWAANAQDIPYKKPPQEILDVLHAPSVPQATVNPSKTHLLLMRPRRYPPIAEVSQPMLRLAGLRINPRNNGLHLPPTMVEFLLKRLDDGKEVPLAIPKDARLSAPRWSPDGRWFAFTNAKTDAIELWLAETASGRVRLVPGVKVNAAYGETVQWLPGSRALLVQTVPVTRGKPPEAPAVPIGPKVQQASGKYSPVRTYQDLLTSSHDENLFDYYATSQLMLVDVASGKATAFGEPGIYRSMDPSPDGNYVLFTKVHRPYSLLHPHTAFPKDVGLWDRQGRMVKILFRLPLEDAVPIEGVPTGPRSIAWRPDEPATLVWVEALDGGDPKKKVSHRDRLMQWKAPFEGEPSEWWRTEHRAFGTDWGRGFALVREYERERRWGKTWLFNFAEPGAAPRIIFSRSIQDRYRDPGTPVEETTPSGHRLLSQDGEFLYLSGLGATPTGARPFLDKFHLRTGETRRLFHSAERGFERVQSLLSRDGSKLLIERQSSTEPPNYFLRDASGSLTALTNFKDPTPQIRGIRKQLVTYKREDGVNLSFTLFLPPGYKEGTRLPTVLWAYPREFVDADTAGQFGGSTERFTTISGTSHLFFLLCGYAVLDDAAMPVVGPPDVANNTYVEQIVSSAKAAIEKAASMGVTDPNRVGVGGHSYGAFMTANLLAHSDLFRAGIARSGAYNRTLTPFGFQAEPRTLWEAPDIYLRMSPFLFAHKIKEPILLIHGEADNNPGTFPIQSERMYQAIRGNAGTARLVLLPYEAHGYVSRESVEHTLAEMIEWFDRYVKNAGETSRTSEALAAR
ncbi:MAG: prolyl oligopeptidase family serine peptidase [Bryobacteraceae bacterium]|nr:prolyl oligopeptidase family serine peptidase [Bryobacteraceae bacterium]MDW8379782.1 prolyl oligopeptidase family serine peptidase [Bryobacterales bacterium]